ncbi:MAG: class I SAM-dependent methyltransferase [Arenicellales bacterium]
MSGKGHDIDQWDRYWGYGNIHSFSQVSGGNYQGAIADFWRSRFRGLAEGSAIVDIATGNGAIALLALEESERLSKGCRIIGVDLADIDPVKLVRDPAVSGQLGRIEFHGRVSAESLPLDDRSIDMACSQFGIEYSDLSRSIPEAARILKPGGRFAAIMHHRESVLLNATRDELDQLDFVLNDVKLYLRTRNFLRALPAVAQRKGSAEVARNSKVEKKQRAVQDALARIRQGAASRTNANLLMGPARYVREILSRVDHTPPAELLEWLEEALRRVVANQRRLIDMVAAAKGPDDIEELGLLLTEAGFSDKRMEVFRQEQGGLLGWSVEALKS